jgi:para-aminobenzoate synthetase component I
MINKSVFSRTYSCEEFISIAERYSDLEGTCLLMSGSDYDSAEQSFLCMFPFQTFSIEASSVTFANPWDQLKEAMKFSDDRYDIPEWAGYLAYEMGAYADADIVIPLKYPSYPLARFHRYAVILQYHHFKEELSLYLNNEYVGGADVRELMDLIEGGAVSQDTPKCNIYCTKPLEEQSAYIKKIEAVKKYIFNGDIYQVNLSQECQYSGEGHPYSVFKRLYQKNPAPFSAYLKIAEKHTIVSSSPERLMRLSKGKLETRPIKGTIPRGQSKQEDDANRKELLSSEKDKSELLMITDLMRNDLGKVATPGSVRTEKIWHCEQYHNVFHLLSLITAEVRPSIHPVDVIRQVFPGGSITGCPKIRAMEIIAEIEDSTRGIYTGAIGYFTGQRGFDFSIAIRTLDFVDDKINLRLGGAIVADSCPMKEYEETLHKGRSIFETLNS